MKRLFPIRFTGFYFCPLLCALALSGCAHPSDADRVSIVAGKKAFVLARFAAHAAGESFFSTDRIPAIYCESLGGDDHAQLVDTTLGNIDPWPDDPATRQGWIYAVLPPGDYHLDLGGLGPDAPEFRFTIPAGAKVVYLGSIDFPVSTSRQGLLGPRYASLKSGPITVLDEQQASLKILHAAFPDVAVTQNLLMVPYPASDIKSLPRPVRVTAAGNGPFIPPDLVNQHMRDGSQIIGAMAISPGFGLIVIPIAVVGIGVGKVVGEGEQRTNAPVFAAFAKEIEVANPAQLLRNHAAEKLGLSAEPPEGPTLSFYLLRVVLVEVSAQNYRWEFTVRARLTAPGNSVALYDRIFTSAPWQTNFPTVVKTDHPLHRLPELSWPNALTDFRSEMNSALNAIADRALGEIDGSISPARRDYPQPNATPTH